MIKKILVTGTSSGLGYQIAKDFLKNTIIGLSRSIGKAKNITKKNSSLLI